MTLALSLCVLSSCAGTGSTLLPAISPGTQGNEICVTLPAGTRVTASTADRAAQLHAVLFSESTLANNTVTFTKPIVLVTPAYLAARDEVELQLERKIERAGIKANANLK